MDGFGADRPWQVDGDKPDPADGRDLEAMGSGLSQSEFHTPPPIPYDSPAKATELAELKNFRTPMTNTEAMFESALVLVVFARTDTGVNR